jgi:hypothetical protein
MSYLQDCNVDRDPFKLGKTVKNNISRTFLVESFDQFSFVVLHSLGGCLDSRRFEGTHPGGSVLQKKQGVYYNFWKKKRGSLYVLGF